MESHEMLQWLIASGRDLGDPDMKGTSIFDGREYTALEMARLLRKRERTAVVALLERFVDDPVKTRHEVRVKLGLLGELAADFFALVVFLCDDLLQLKPALFPSSASAPNPAAVRFFIIAFKLPMELQMVLCHRVVGSMKQNILAKDSEAAFKTLAKILLLSQPE